MSLDALCLFLPGAIWLGTFHSHTKTQLADYVPKASQLFKTLVYKPYTSMKSEKQD